ncbi:MAG: hypothetical protein GEV03_21570 [Streptosporangiales bacterium]|nr:hypothetical protein [Streptosporangiales bacterium]
MTYLSNVGLPDLVPPPPSELAAPKAAAEPAPCAAVTRQALQDLSDTITAAREKAEANVAVNGEGAPGAVYPVAATLGRDHLIKAHDNTTVLLAWVDKWGVPPGLIGYPAISYGIYGYCRDVLPQLHHARHWETVNAVYNASRGTAAVTVECINLITAAVELAEPLATNATGCYLAAYGL